MRNLCPSFHQVALAATAICVITAAPAVAADCCDTPTVVYGAAPVAILPPVGYVLDPSDAYRPVYIVNQGPTSGAWIGALAQPTYSEGGYAIVEDCAPVVVLPPRHYPYVRSYYGDRWFDAPRPPRRYSYVSSRDRMAAAYRYRPAASAKVIRVGDPRDERPRNINYRHAGARD